MSFASTIEGGECYTRGRDGWAVSLGSLLRERRDALGLTQEDVAERIGKDQNYVSFVETGRIKQPRRAMLEAFARALELPPPRVFAAAGWAPPPDLDEQQAVDLSDPLTDWSLANADKLTPRQKRLLIAMGDEFLAALESDESEPS